MTKTELEQVAGALLGALRRAVATLNSDRMSTGRDLYAEPLLGRDDLILIEDRWGRMPPCSAPAPSPAPAGSDPAASPAGSEEEGACVPVT